MKIAMDGSIYFQQLTAIFEGTLVRSSGARRQTWPKQFVTYWMCREGPPSLLHDPKGRWIIFDTAAPLPMMAMMLLKANLTNLQFINSQFPSDKTARTCAIASP